MTNKMTVRVHFIDGATRIVLAKDIKHVGEEGARSGTALYEGREYPIYNRSDWPDPWLWQEQIEQRSGVCVECERNVTMLSVSGLCQGCVMDAVIAAQEPPA